MPAPTQHFSTSSLLLALNQAAAVGRLSSTQLTQLKAVTLAFLEYSTDPQSWSESSLKQFLAQPIWQIKTDSNQRWVLNQLLHQFPPHSVEVALPKFILALRHNNCSNATIRNYRSDINQFFDFCQTNDLTRAITKSQIKAFERFQAENGLQPSSIRRKTTSISLFLEWAKQNSLFDGQLSADAEPVAEPVEVATPMAPVKSTTPAMTAVPVAVATVAAPKAKPPTQNSTETPATLKPVLPDTYRALQQNLDDRFNVFSRQVQRRLFPLWLGYLNILVLLLVVLGIGIFGYRQFLRDVSQPLAYPSSPISPNRVLSFQARLTDTAQNPITSVTPVEFRLYDADSGGNLLWDSGVCNITPDQDGIFNTQLGDTCGGTIGEEVFSENQNVWLEIEVDAEVLSPRQPIATVPYALNSETLQGYPISATGGATVNTILFMDGGGSVVLGETNPEIRSVSGTFTLEGESLLLQTTNNGNIVLDANGLGGVVSRDYIHTPGATLSATYAGGVPLTLQGGPSGTGNILNINNNTGTSLANFASDGSLTVSQNSGYAATLFSNTLSFSRAAENYIRAENAAGSLIFRTGGNNNRLSISASGNFDFATGTTAFNGLTYTWPGSQAAGYILSTNGSGTLSWVDPALAGASSVHWSASNGAIYPKNSTMDVLIGGQSSASAIFKFLNMASGTPTASFSGNLTLNSAGVIETTNNQTLSLGGSNTGHILLNSDGGNRVGIGTTAPGNLKLQVYDSSFADGNGEFSVFDGTYSYNIGYDAQNNGSNRFSIFRNSSQTFLTNSSGGFVFSENGSTFNNRLLNSGLIIGPSVSGTTPIGALDLRRINGTQSVATISGATSFASLVVDNSGVGDIFTASSSGLNRFVITQNGNVGIGTTTPVAKLQINTGADAAIGQIIRANSGTQTANLSEWQNSSGTLLAGMNEYGHLQIGSIDPGENTGAYIRNSLTPATAALTGSSALTAQLNISSGADNISTNLGGLNFTVTNAGSGTRSYIYGGSGSVTHNGTNTITTLDVLNLQAVLGTSGGVTNGHGLRVLNYSQGGAGTIGNYYAVRIENQTSASNNAHGLYIGNITGGTTSNYALLTNAGNIVFNEGGDASTDLRVEGDTDANLLFTDASTDRVGIGTSSPSQKLHLNAVSGNIAAYIQSAAANQAALFLGDTTTGIYRPASSTRLALYESSGERISIVGGNVGIGTTSPGALLHVGSTAPTSRYTQISTNGEITARRDDNSSGTVFPLSLENRDGTAATTHQLATRFRFGSTGDTTAIEAGRIQVGKEQEWTSTASTQDSFLAFYTALDGTSAEKLRITSNGNVGIGDTSPASLFTVGNGDLFQVNSSGNIVAVGGVAHSLADSSGDLVLTSNGELYLNDTRTGNIALSVSDTAIDAGLPQGIVDAINEVYGTVIGNSVWAISNGALYPANSTVDLLIGGQSTASARFAVTNINGSGNVTASMSGTTTGNALSLTGDGTIATSLNRSLLLNPNGGNVGIGTTNPNGLLHLGSGSSVGSFANPAIIFGTTNNGFYTDTNRIVVKAGSLAAGMFTSSGLEGNGTNGYRILSNWTLSDTTPFLTPDKADSTTGFGGTSGTLSLITNGASRIKIDNSGNVGIGTTTPTALLDIAGSASTSGTLSFRGTTDPKINVLNGETFGIRNSPGGDAGLTERLTILGSGYVGIATTNPSAQLHVSYNTTPTSIARFGTGTLSQSAWMDVIAASGSRLLQLWDDNNLTTPRFIVERHTGNVGIGTTTPVANLHVVGYYGSNAAAIFNQTNSGDILAASASGTNRMVLTNAGRLGLGTTFPGQALHVVGNGYFDTSAGELTIQNTGSSSVELYSSGSLVFDTAAAQSISFQIGDTTLGGFVNSNFGIGTTNPTNRLEVAGGNVFLQAQGDIRFGDADSSHFAAIQAPATISTNYTLTLPDTDGDSGQVLSTDGSGVLSWTGVATLANIYWYQNNGALYPANSTVDLLIGGQSTASARFAVTNINGSGNVTASMSGTTTGNALSLTGNGTIATSLNRSLLLNPNGGNVGIGTTNPGSILHTVGTAGTSIVTTSTGGNLRLAQAIGTSRSGIHFQNFTNSHTGISSDGYSLYFGNASNSVDPDNWTSTTMALHRNGNFGLGTSTPIGKLHVTGAPGAGGNALAIFNQTGSSDILAASASGTNRFVITNAGNVGIGTTLPSYPLHIVQSGSGFLQPVTVTNPGDPGSGATRLVVSNTASAFMLQAYGSTAPGSLANAASIYASAGDRLLLGARSGASVQLFSNDSYNAPQFTLTTAGNVGIGTTTPTALLDIAGSASTSGTLSFRGTTDPKINVLNGETFGIRNSPGGDAGLTERLTILGSGYVGIGTTVPADLLHLMRNQNAQTRGRVSNNNAGTAATAEFMATNDDTAGGAIRLLAMGTGWTTAGGYVQDSGVLAADQNLSGGLSIIAREPSAPIRFYTGGSTNEWMRITSTGLVGIGTTTPNTSNLVTISNNGATTSPLALVDTAASGDTFWLHNRALGIAGYFGLYSEDASSYRFVINGSGFMGIGTTTPTARLDILGSASTSGTLAFRGTTDPKIDILNGEAFGIRTSPGGDTGLTERVTVLSNGNVGIGTTIPTAALQITNVSSPQLVIAGNANGNSNQAYSVFERPDGVDIGFVGDFSASNQAMFLGSSTSYLQLQSASGTEIRFAPGGTDHLRLHSSGGLALGSGYVSTDPGAGGFIASGNVGIGTTSPTNALELGTGNFQINAQGDVRLADSDSTNYAAIQAPATIGANYTLTLPDTDGDTGQVLSTDGSGVLSWSTVATLANVFWYQANGALYPANSTVDVLFGGQASTSANFAFINNSGSGTPTASISGNVTLNHASGAIQSTNNRSLTLGGNTTGNIILSPNNNSGGRVAIGTTAPEGFAHLMRSSSNRAYSLDGNDMLILEAFGTNRLRWISGNTAHQLLSFSDEDAEDRGVIAYLHDIDALSFAANGATSMRISSDHNVGIGTTAIQHRLHVQGGYGSNALAVFNELNGADIIAASASGSTRFRVDTSGYTHSQRFLDLANSAYFLDPAATGTSLAVAGDIGINTTAPQARIHAISTTEQLRLGYDNSNWVSLTVDNTGDLSFFPLGGGVSFTADVNISGTLRLNGLTYTWPASQTAGSVLRTNGSGTLSWVSPETAFGAYWRLGSGALSPTNNTLDVLIGNNASASANFAFLNNAGGTPTASIAGNLAFNSAGVIQSTQNRTLTIGGNSTGNIILNPLNGTGRVGLGTTAPSYMFEMLPTAGDPSWALGDVDVAHGVTGQATTTTILHAAPLSSTNGGVQLSAFADQVAGAQPLEIRGITGSTDPTNGVPMIQFTGARRSGTGLADLAAAETLFQVRNNDEAAALTIMGDGDIGLGTTTPGYALHLERATARATMMFRSLAAGDGHAEFEMSSRDGFHSNLIFSTNDGTSSIGNMWQLSAQSDTDMLALFNWTITSGANTLRFDNASNRLLVGNAGDFLGLMSLNTGGGDVPAFGKAVLTINQAETNGDLIAASASGTTRFMVNNSGFIGIGTSLPTAPVHVTYSHSGNGGWFGANFAPIGTGANSSSLTGVRGTANAQPGSSNTLTTAYGVDGITSFNSAGTITAGIGVRGVITNNSTGTITSAFGLFSQNAVNGGGGSIGTAYGVYAEQQTAATTNWTMYSVAGNNFFGGDIAINETAAVLNSGNIPGSSVILGNGIVCVDNGGSNCDDAARTAGTVYSVNAAVTGIDVAENYPSFQSLEAGDIVSIDRNNDEFVVKSDASYQDHAIGVVSTKPGLLLGGFDPESTPGTLFPIALAGRVPTKVSTENGPIRRGDLLTSSSRPGVAMKATSAGRVIARALEDYTNPNTTEVSKIEAFIDTTYFDPAISITSTGNISIAGNDQAPIATATYTASFGSELLTKVDAFADLAVANLKAGVIRTRQLLAEVRIQTPEVQTDLISPIGETVTVAGNIAVTNDLSVAQNLTVANDTDLAGDLNVSGTTALGSLIAQTASVSGDATVSGTLDVTSARISTLEARLAELAHLRAQTAELVNATVSGTLYADNIDGFQDKVASALEQPSLLSKLLDQQSEATPSASVASVFNIIDQAGYTASGAASLNQSLEELALSSEEVAIGASAVFINKYFEVNGNGYIAGKLGVAEQLLVGQGTVIADGSISYQPAGESQPTFFIQPSGQGSINILAGAMTIAENGFVNITGDLAVGGNLTVEDTLLTDLLKPTDFTNPLQVQVAGVSTESGQLQESRFEIVNELGAPVATISAQGRAAFAGGLSVGSQDLTGSENQAETSQTSGKATVTQGQTEMVIKSELLTNDSLVQVTPQGSTNNQVMYVKSVTAENPATTDKEGQFVVGFDTALLDRDVNFTWWIVN